MKNSIKYWSVDDRPREKLLLKGKESLSKAELLAILIGSGSKEESAVDLSKRILNTVKYNLHKLGRLSVSDLCQFHGVGKAKAVTIITALELGRRRLLESAEEQKKITCSRDIFHLFSPLLSDLIEEQFWVLYLDHRLQVLQQKMISSGGFTQTLVDIRKIFKYALEANATHIILAHNHPTGNLNPSEADKCVTQKIQNAGKIMDIKLLDHLIIAQNDYMSFADKEMI